LVDRAMGPDAKRTKMTVRPNSERVILSVASQPGALRLVDLTKVGRHETKVKLLAMLPPGETEAVPPARDRVPEGYPLARQVHLHLSPKASEAAQAFFAFLNEGGGGDAIIASGLVPRQQPKTPEADIAAAYHQAAESDAARPPAQTVAANEHSAPPRSAPDPLHDVLRSAIDDPPAMPPERSTAAATQAAPAPTAEDPITESPMPGSSDTPPQSEQAEEADAIASAPGSAGHSLPPGAPAAEADFLAWITAYAVPVGLGGVCVVALAIALGSLGMKRARHRNEVMRRYRP
jgi:hypothetical protein